MELPIVELNAIKHLEPWRGLCALMKRGIRIFAGYVFLEFSMTRLQNFSMIGCLASMLASATIAHAASITTLYNTGTNAAHGTLADGTLGDPHYTLVAVPPGSVTDILIRTAVGGFPADFYKPGDDALSTCIGPNSLNFPFGHFGGPNDLIDFPGTYDYRTTFDLTGLDLASAMILGNWSADNVGLDILLNGISLGDTTPADAYLTGFVPFSISSGFHAGLNTLDFLVSNAGINNSPTALRVEMSGTADLATIPEPATWLLLSVGLIGMAVSRRRAAK